MRYTCSCRLHGRNCWCPTDALAGCVQCVLTAWCAVLFCVLLCSFAGAYHWADTSAESFTPVMYYNDSFEMPDDGSDIGSKYTRKPQLLNMAVNSWLSNILGEQGALSHLVRLRKNYLLLDFPSCQLYAGAARQKLRIEHLAEVLAACMYVLQVQVCRQNFWVLLPSP